MSYRAFPESAQPGLEETQPDRFENGSEWTGLAGAAIGFGGGSERFSPADWANLLRVSPTIYRDPVVASSLWRLLTPYEIARLRARYITLEGLLEIEALKDEYTIALRGATAPDEIRSLRAAIDVLIQAETDPERRLTGIQLLRKWDALGIALYRRADAPPDSAALELKLRKNGCFLPGERTLGFGRWKFIRDQSGNTWVCPVEVNLGLSFTAN
jgi:hypothetical protein